MKLLQFSPCGFRRLHVEQRARVLRMGLDRFAGPAIVRMLARHRAAYAHRALALAATLALTLMLATVTAQAATIEVNSLDDDPAPGAPDCTLRAAIIAANANAAVGGCTAGEADATLFIITFDIGAMGGSTITLGGSQLPTITSSIQIDGLGIVTLDANDSSRHFRVQATGNLILNGLTLVHGHAESGGALYNDGGQVTLSETTLQNNQANANGGGFFNTNGGQATLTDAQILANTVTGGATYNDIDPGGGGFYNAADGQVTVTGSVIRANLAHRDGGGFINWQGQVDLSETLIEDNQAGNDGGSFYNSEGQVTLIASQVLANRASGIGGGFVNEVNGQVTLAETLIQNNQSGLSGGGFYSADAGSHVGIAAGQIVSNTANLGGGFYNADGSQVALSETVIQGNQSNAGAGFANSSLGSRVTLTASQVLANLAIGVGGGFTNESEGQVTLHETLIQDNVSALRGGGFYNSSDGRVTLTGSEIRANAATDGDGGGFINWRGQVTLSDTLIQDNQAGNSGGGFFNGDSCCPSSTVNSQVSITGSQIVSNTADITDIMEDPLGGGGGFYNGIGGQVDLSETLIQNNRAAFFGGGFNNGGGQFTLTDSQIRANTALLAGGGFFIFSTTGRPVTISNSQILSNTSAEGGGLLIVPIVGQVTVSESLIQNNHASARGGGFTNSGPLTVIDSQIFSNTATRGGGGFFIYFPDDPVTISNSQIVGNTTDGDGGGFLMAHGVGQVTVSETLIQHNQAGNDGGGFFNGEDGILNVTQSCIVDNSDTAAVHGETEFSSILHSTIAQHNWWGASDGPGGAGPGSGDSVSSGVDFDPFLSSAPAACAQSSMSFTFASAASNPPGQSYQLAVTLLDSDSAPMPDVEVTFQALSGPNAGILGAAATDANGEARLVYSSSALGVDTIVASFVSAEGATYQSNPVTIDTTDVSDRDEPMGSIFLPLLTR